MKTMLRLFLALLMAQFPLTAMASDAGNYPTKPLRMLVGSPPGASTDTYARMVAEPLGKLLGQNVVVENRTGASGIVATRSMLNSPSDGYMMQFIYTSFTLVPSLYKDVAYDTEKDLRGVSMIVKSPLVLVVGAGTPLNSLDDLVALARKRSLNFGSAGVGSGGHLTGEMLRLAKELAAVHVPYRGAAPAASAVAAGDVDFAFVAQVTAKELMEAGKLRPLALTGTARSPMLPDVPTMQELGLKEYEFFNWFGIVMPADTPPSIVDKLGRSIAQVLSQPEVRKRLEADGSEVIGSQPAEFNAFLHADMRKWGKLVQEIGIKQE